MIIQSVFSNDTQDTFFTIISKHIAFRGCTARADRVTLIAMNTPQPRRPVLLNPTALAAAAGSDDPTERARAAHATAWLMVQGARDQASDSDLAQRITHLADEHGLDLLAALWADAPADSLPGVLWRLYALRAWVHQAPEAAAQEFSFGQSVAEVDNVVAGVADPPGPAEVAEMIDAVFAGMLSSDFAIAIERAAAFMRVCATGRAHQDDADVAAASKLMSTSQQLQSAARHWRLGTLT